MPKYEAGSEGNPLDVLVEEAAEVIQAVMKIKRFGLAGTRGPGHQTPREKLVQELGDLIVVAAWLSQDGVFTDEEMEAAMDNKVERLKELFGIKVRRP
jgi:NTP pyrophosphatase (non-canonical NTP hydrolase)